MRIENLVLDVHDPSLVGGFWTVALDAQPITNEPGIVEARLTAPAGFWLDLCFQQTITESPAADRPRQTRLHMDLTGGPQQRAVVDRLVGLGATPADIGQHDVPWIVLADPEQNTFCVMEERAVYSDTGPIAALPLDSADPGRDAAFWAAISGWMPGPGVGDATLRHPSGTGPLLEFCPEPAPKATKNTLHLDVRPESGDPDLVALALSLGARPVEHDWGELPWTVLVDPSGNEFCILER